MTKGPSKVVDLAQYRKTRAQKRQTTTAASCKTPVEAISPPGVDHARLEELAQLQRQVETLKNMVLFLTPATSRITH
jgi:hypothetical protein